MKRIAVVCGGYSGESVVSMRSASMIMNHMDRTKYTPVKIVITRTAWFADFDGIEVVVDKNDFTVTHHGQKMRFDGAFIIIHGTPGEDGLLQGYFTMLGIPHTTGDVLNMAITFNKKATTRLLGSLGFSVAKSITLHKDEPYSITYLTQQLGLPAFVKPNCGGSSIGTSRVNSAQEFHIALEKAFHEDDQVIIEEFIEGTEVTCGVIRRNGKITALPVTEIVSKKEFFDFEAKYQGASEEITPARIPHEVALRIRQSCEDIYQRLNCRGMIRVDWIIRGDEPFAVEVNTVPGFSEASIIPQQAAVAGINKTELITAVLEGEGI
ncbi:MAG: D-alanine--D-alanine ligase [Flavobacteriales bacterium]|jgi:D-alanine-D-alanine ligase